MVKPVKVWFQAPAGVGECLRIIAIGLCENRPAGVETVWKKEEADLIVEFSLGLPCLERIRRNAAGKPFAVYQICLETSGTPVPELQTFWSEAKAVVGYLDLGPLCPNFTRLSPGVDFDFFRPSSVIEWPSWDLCTHGYVSDGASEPIIESHDAVRAMGGRAIHVGGKCYPNQDRVERCENVPRERMLEIFRKSRYVSALRWIEGFEMPGFEALACGTRPIAFDIPCYRYWFGEHASYVPYRQEGIVEAIAKVLKENPKPVSAQERDELYERFSWPRVADRFWRAVTPEAY